MWLNALMVYLQTKTQEFAFNNVRLISLEIILQKNVYLCVHKHYLGLIPRNLAYHHVLQIILEVL